MTLRRHGIAFACSLALSAPVLVATAAAQNATTSLRGTVRDPSGAVVPGAVIQLEAKATGQHLTATASASGEYTLEQIAPATYTITVTAAGFGAQTKLAQLLVNQPAKIDFSLSLQANTEVVDVSASAQSLNTTDASLGDAKNNEYIQALPSETRNPADLVSLEPGVFFLPTPVQSAPEQDSRSGTVNGERSDQGNITLDGVDDNDQVRGLAFFPVLRETQDSIEEFRTTTGNANADAGRSSGAQISLVTKSGTNKYHGAAYEYFRPSNTVSNDYFNKQAQLSSGLDNRPPKLIRNIFGADVGGFVVKDKLFFFGNFEGQRQAESAVVTATTPTALFKQGVLQYTSGGQNVQVSPSQLAALDAGCTVCDTSAYPEPAGANPNVLAYFAQLPTANSPNPGAGDGVNTAAYTFASPNPVRLNTSIVRLDYDPNSKQRIFARGNLQKDTIAGTEQFPGQAPSTAIIDNTKGMTFGDTWTITTSLVNDLRYGYTRQGYGNSGQGSGDYVDFRFLSSPTAESRNTIVSVPVNNLIDNLTWTKGAHTLSFGANWRLVHQNRTGTGDSFNSASTNPYWLGGAPPDPTTLGLPPVDSGFENSYLVAYATLVGTVPSVTDVSNYEVTSATTGTLLADGAPVVRHFKANEYEGYIQDSWRAQPNLTVTFGLRYTLLQTPWETHGQQVAPNIDTHTFFEQRETAALAGQIYDPDFAFTPSGPYYHKPGLWPQSKDNFAPRFAVAYSPNGKTSVRAGAGMYYDHYGEGLINTYDQNGSFGLSSAVTNPAAGFTTETAPRFTGNRNIPFNNGAVASTQAFPYTPGDEFAITWGLDSKLKTPYTEAFDLSVQRDLPAGMTLEVAYVGRLGKHLLQSLDLTQPVDYTDPQGGGDYYSAGTQLSKIVDAHGDGPATVGAIPYFEHVFPYMQNLEYPGETATQAIYDYEWAPSREDLGATTALADLDEFCYAEFVGQPLPCPANHVPRFWQNQFASLYALSTIGMSYYNAAQVTLRRPSRHGLQFDINYTYSKSIDMGSDAERTSEFSSAATTGTAGAASEIGSSYRPYLNRARSDFDTRHIVTADWVYQLPFGKGRAYLSNMNSILNAFIGGWQSDGIFRVTSGLPFSLFEPGYTTDWQIPEYAVVTDPSLKAHLHFDSKGNPVYFASPTAINNGVLTGNPVRLPYPGEDGERNKFTGDGYLDLDSGLAKNWKLNEYGTLRFTWEVYNVTNTVRFDPFSIAPTLTQTNLGTASSELSQARRMQFSLRYDF